MFDAYVIEVANQTVGIVTHNGRTFCFHSAVPKFNSLDGKFFRTPDEATRAAIILVSRIKLTSSDTC